MHKIERLVNLTAYLLNSEHPVTFEKLRQTVYSQQSGDENALHRMFERDKKELREMGIEVQTVSAPLDQDTGYTIYGEDYYLPELKLTPEEKVGVTIVSRLFLRSGTPFGGPAQFLLLKLGFDSEKKISLEDAVPHIHWIGVSRDSELLNAVLEGLVRRKRLRFSYRSWNSTEDVDREVDTYGVFNRDGYWYLVGYCHLRNDIRSFKLDRITTSVEVNRRSWGTPDYQVPASFDLDEITRWDSLGSGKRRALEATVRFEPPLAFDYPGEGCRVKSSNAGSGGSRIVTYEVTDPDSFIGWILEFGAGARVLAPRELVTEILERARGALGALSDDV